MAVLNSPSLIRLFRARVIVLILTCSFVLCVWNLENKTPEISTELMTDQTLEYFLSQGKMQVKDAADIEWAHAANSKNKITEALQSSAHMIEADILLRSNDPKDPIMAHPPETDSDVTLRDWLKEVKASDKGIKLDFKSLAAVAPSMVLLDEVRAELHGPVWINADILPGPGGKATPLDPKVFLEAAVTPGSHGDVLSLGWTTGWTADTHNPGYSWEMVREMEAMCRTLRHPVTFPVRAALLAQSFSQLHWLLQQSDRSNSMRSQDVVSALLKHLILLISCSLDGRTFCRYSLTIWTGHTDVFVVKDLLPYRSGIDKTRIYYDLLDSQRTQLRGLTGY
ncbi:protein FAM151B isoform X1 [Oncorhynchus kisutch]|uniref:Family with sequence similarity 151 member B n=1 Tax=Oncorhynchus kisutch TaxID=8019 RepID=A0A8C7JQT1_ONCKI|nr:protein FAM151B isoform X1 [Oncorhynchus kisutch]